MSTNFDLEFRQTSVPNKVRLCGVNQHNVTTSPGTSINITFPGTPPFEVHSTLYSVDYAGGDCAWHRLPANLSTNTFIWTPIALGRRPTPEVEGNETDYRIIISDGDSLVWVAKELQGNLDDLDAENMAYVSGNHTIMSPELALQRAVTDASNGALLSAGPLSFKAFAIVGMMALAMMRV